MCDVTKRATSNENVDWKKTGSGSLGGRQGLFNGPSDSTRIRDPVFLKVRSENEVVEVFVLMFTAAAA